MSQAQASPQPAVALSDAAPAVTFVDARRPESATHVDLGEWEGPLGLLLALIEARQLDVLTVPLGSLADAYLDALATINDDRLGHVSSFVAIASQLILLKSRALLPRQPVVGAVPVADDGPDPEAQLRARLLLYKAFREAGARLQADATEVVGLFHREPAAAAAAGLAGARPSDGPPLDRSILVAALAGLARIAPPPEPPPEVVPRTITLAERAEIIRAALRDAGAVVLQELLAGVRDRVVVAVTFLALLELVKRREITIEQAEPWGPIVATAVRTGDGGQAITDEPIDESLESFA